MRLAEANPLTGALKFELPEGGSAPIEPRGARPEPKKKGRSKHPQGKQGHMQGKRGRPGNIRHQGKRK